MSSNGNGNVTFPVPFEERKVYANVNEGVLLSGALLNWQAGQHWATDPALFKAFLESFREATPEETEVYLVGMIESVKLQLSAFRKQVADLTGCPVYVQVNFHSVGCTGFNLFEPSKILEGGEYSRSEQSQWVRLEPNKEETLVFFGPWLESETE